MSSTAGTGPARNTALFLGALAILVLVFLAYFPALRGPFIWDDDSMLTRNPLISSDGGLAQIWCGTQQFDYFPLTSTSFWLEWRCWGMNPAGYRVVNVLLHALSAVLLWRIFKRLHVPGAWVAALLFALHPVCVASVAWIAERKNTLSLFFFLLSLLCYLRFDSASRITHHASRDPYASSLILHPSSFYLLSLFAFLLALLSKTSVVMLPVLLLGCCWWRRGTVTRRDAWRSLPFFILSLALGLVTVWFQTHRAMDTLTRTHPLFERLLGGTWAFWLYLYKAFVPANLAAYYPRGNLAPASLRAWLPALLLLAGFIALLPPRRPWQRACLFAFGFFLVTLLPVLGFFDMALFSNCVAADHWQYLPLIGIVALAVGSIAHFLAAKLTRPLPWERVLAALFIALFALLSWQRAGAYADPELLWRQTLRSNPHSWIAHGNLAKILDARGQKQEALAHWRIALQLKPDWPEVMNNLAWALATCPDPAVRNPAEAIQLAERARASAPRSPSYLDTLAAAYAAAGRFPDAVAAARQAVALAEAAGPTDAAARFRLRFDLYRTNQPFHEPE